MIQSLPPMPCQYERECPLKLQGCENEYLSCSFANGMNRYFERIAKEETFINRELLLKSLKEVILGGEDDEWGSL
jgi:hypothetical protein